MATPSVSHLEQEVILPIGAGDPHDLIVTVETKLAVTPDDGYITIRRVESDPHYLVRRQQSTISAPHSVTATTHKHDLTFPLSVAETRAIGTGWRRFGVEPIESAVNLGHAVAGIIKCATAEVMSPA